MVSQFRFAEAVSLVEAWLDREGASFAKRVPPSQARKNAIWDLDISDLGYPILTIRLVIGPLFPAIPCELYVDKALCLVIPHIEENGRACLDDKSRPGDYTDPVNAVLRVISRFRTELLEPSSNDVWCQEQLQVERLSYWARFCDQRRKGPRGRPTPRATYVNLEHIELWAEGRIAAYIPNGSKHRRFNVQVVTLGDTDPVELAQQHRWANGTVIKGRAVFVRIPDSFEWTPSNWPKSFIQLESLVRATTEDNHSVTEWLQRTGWSDKMEVAEDVRRLNRASDGPMPLLVVFVQGAVLYGYQISPSIVSMITAPSMAPIKITRIDSSWSLTRDHAAQIFEHRRAKRVLVLGCGSLGSPVVEALARSGVGQIDIVDSQLLDSPNVSRHVLGLSTLRQSKAEAMAARLIQEVPGNRVRGFYQDAHTWVVSNCKPGVYDLIIDCTAESSVRVFLAHLRNELFGASPVIHAWVEPYCAAAHVVATTMSMPWPSDDPADSHVNVADYSETATRVKLPACSDGFHPYGIADIVQAAGFAAERVISVLDRPLPDSTVWSWIRSKAFFESLQAPIQTRSLVPSGGTAQDAVMITRRLHTVLDSDE